MMDIKNLKKSLINGWSDIHPGLLEPGHSDKHYSDILDSIITSHPHVRVVTHFADSYIFQKLIDGVKIENGLSRDEVKEKYLVIKERLEKLDKITKDIDPKDFAPNDLLPYIDILAHHIISEGYDVSNKIRYLTRFGSHRINRHDIQSKMLQVLDDMYLIHSHKDDIETGGYKSISTWHDVMSCCWAFIEGGFVDHTKFVIDTLINLTEKIQENQPNNRIFELWCVRENQTFRDYGKHLRSSYAIAGPFYASIGETNKAIEIFKKSINLFEKILGYTEINRVVEHAIELYKIQPTEENKLLAIDLFIKHKTSTPHEPTETVREAGVIALMLLQDVFKVTIP